MNSTLFQSPKLLVLLLATATSGLCVRGAEPAPHREKYVQVELNNGNFIKGRLMNIDRTRLVLRLSRGTSIYPTSSIKRITPIPREGSRPRVESPEIEEEEPAAVAEPELLIGGRENPPPAAKGSLPAADRKLIALMSKPGKAARKRDAPKKEKFKMPKIRLDAQTASKGLEPVIHWIAKGNFSDAAHTIRKLVNSGDLKMIGEADGDSRTRFNCSLSELLIQCYLKVGCKKCRHTGQNFCPKCKGDGYMAFWVTKERGEPGGVKPGIRRKVSHYIRGFILAEWEKTFRRVRICDLCRGYGSEVCTDCSGTKRRWIEPSTFEREPYANRLVELADQVLYKNERSYGDTIRERPPDYRLREGGKMRPMIQQVWLRDSIGRVKSDLLRLHCAKGYYEAALKADKTLTFRTKRDFDEELRRLDTRLRHLYGELTERQLVYATNRTERRLDESTYGEGKSQTSNFGEILGDD